MPRLHSTITSVPSIVDYSVGGTVFFMDDTEVGAYEEIDENPPVCDYEVYPADSSMAQMCKERTMHDKRIAEEKRRVEELLSIVEMEKDHYSKNLKNDEVVCEKKRTARSLEVKSKEIKHGKRSVEQDSEELKIVNNETAPVKKSRKSEANPPLKYRIERRKGSDDLMFVPIITLD